MQSITDVCTQDMGNLGFESCAVMPERIEGFMLAPRSFSLTAANLADDTTLLGVLQTASLAAKTSRNFPFFNGIDDMADNTPAVTVETSGYGNHRGVMYGKPMFAVTLRNNGIHLFQQMYKYVGNKGASIGLVDKSGTLFMRKNGTGAKYMPCQLYPEPIKMATGTTEAVMVVNIVLDEEDAFLNQAKLYSYPTASTFVWGDNLHGIHDVELKQVSVAATTATIKAQLPANFYNMSTLYGTELAASGAWVVTNKATGAAVTPSGVTVSNGNFVIAGLTTATTYYMSLATPAALFALGSPVGSKTTGGYESNVIEVTTA